MPSSLPDRVRYLTNSAGQPTDVLIPISLWEQLIATLRDPDSGLALLDEQEPNPQLLADLQQSLQQAHSGQTLPASQLWQEIDS